MSFLKAEWRKLAMANYAVEPDVLKPYLPAHTELDFWEGNCYVSVVGFMFLNTRLMGIPIPFHRNFEEVNLRFYVRYRDANGWKRGVVFIKEIVPKPALTFVANTIYKEHYQTLKMDHEWREDGQSRQVTYRWFTRERAHSIQLTTERDPVKLEPDSDAAFITEHYWGYTSRDANTSYEYEVTHPTSDVYPVITHEIEVGFGEVYGPDFAFLEQENPLSVMLAEGSEISVENKRLLTG